MCIYIHTYMCIYIYICYTPGANVSSRRNTKDKRNTTYDMSINDWTYINTQSKYTNTKYLKHNTSNTHERQHAQQKPNKHKRQNKPDIFNWYRTLTHLEPSAYLKYQHIIKRYIKLTSNSKQCHIIDQSIRCPLSQYTYMIFRRNRPSNVDKRKCLWALRQA